MHRKYFLLCLHLYFYCQFQKYIMAGSVSYISTERPVITYLNKKLVSNATMISQRLYRKDPRYYVSFFIDLLVPGDNNMKFNFYFHEFVHTNKYRPTFLEMHFRFCDMIEKDPIFGSQVKRNLNLQNKSCPIPPGSYSFTEMAIPYVPKSFPLKQGRIYCNVTLDINATLNRMGEAYIDMEIKLMNDKQKQ